MPSSLAREVEEVVDSAAQEKSTYFANIHELNFKLHEQQQHRILLRLQVFNLFAVTTLLIFLVIYYRPSGLYDYLVATAAAVASKTKNVASAAIDKIQVRQAQAPTPPPAPTTRQQLTGGSSTGPTKRTKKKISSKK